MDFISAITFIASGGLIRVAGLGVPDESRVVYPDVGTRYNLQKAREEFERRSTDLSLERSHLSLLRPPFSFFCNDRSSIYFGMPRYPSIIDYRLNLLYRRCRSIVTVGCKFLLRTFGVSVTPMQCLCTIGARYLAYSGEAWPRF